MTKAETNREILNFFIKLREENCPKYQGFSLCRQSICPLCVSVNVCFYLLWCDTDWSQLNLQWVPDQTNIWSGASPDVSGDISPSQSQEMTMKTMPRPTNYPGLGQAWFVHFKSSLILATVFTFLTVPICWCWTPPVHHYWLFLSHANFISECWCGSSSLWYFYNKQMAGLLLR